MKFSGFVTENTFIFERLQVTTAVVNPDFEIGSHCIAGQNLSGKICGFRGSDGY